MSLMKTLGRVATGIVLAKGIGAAMQRHQQGGSVQRQPGWQGGRGTTGQSGDVATGGQPRQGGLLDDLFGDNTRPGGGTSLNDLLSRVLGGRQGGVSAGGGSARSSAALSGLGGLLDRLSVGHAAPQGGLSGTASGASLPRASAGAPGSARSGAQPDDAGGNASFGALFNQAVLRQDEPDGAPTPEQNARAGLMLRAMIQAARSDGTMDDTEKQRLLARLGDTLDENERQFIRDQMVAPIDPEALARDVPPGLGPQIYLMSLLAIDLDHPDEVRYLDRLARALQLETASVAEIHALIGLPRPAG